MLEGKVAHSHNIRRLKRLNLVVQKRDLCDRSSQSVLEERVPTDLSMFSLVNKSYAMSQSHPGGQGSL